ncbi:MAG: hypothetical protein RIT49_408 [Actinomycetota bacterium]
MIINCDSCIMRNIACNDCVVSVLLNIKPLPGKNAEFSDQDEVALNHLATAGLVPPLRYRRRGAGGQKLQNLG